MLKRFAVFSGNHIIGCYLRSSIAARYKRRYVIMRHRPPLKWRLPISISRRQDECAASGNGICKSALCGAVQLRRHRIAGYIENIKQLLGDHKQLMAEIKEMREA